MCVRARTMCAQLPVCMGMHAWACMCKRSCAHSMRAHAVGTQMAARACCLFARAGWSTEGHPGQIAGHPLGTPPGHSASNTRLHKHPCCKHTHGHARTLRSEHDAIPDESLEIFGTPPGYLASEWRALQEVSEAVMVVERRNVRKAKGRFKVRGHAHAAFIACVCCVRVCACTSMCLCEVLRGSRRADTSA